jgi:hypothetical protein
LEINKEEVIKSDFRNLRMKDAPKVACSQGMHENLKNEQKEKQKGTA